MGADNTSHFIQLSKDVPLHTFLGIELGEHNEGYGELRVPIKENLINAAGAVHGGIYYILCDVAATFAFSTVVDENTFYATHDINVSVLRPAFSGELIARANVIKAGKRIGFVECKIFDADNNMLAAGRITKTILPAPDTLQL